MLRNERRSTTSFQVFIEGNLLESRVRAQKATSLSSEFVAVAAGSSDGLLIKHLWEKITEEKCEMKVRSNSSAARPMVQRQGIGQVTAINCADLGPKALQKEAHDGTPLHVENGEAWWGQSWSIGEQLPCPLHVMDGPLKVNSVMQNPRKQVLTRTHITHSLTHSLPPSLTHSLTHSLIHLLTIQVLRVGLGRFLDQTHQLFVNGSMAD